MMLAWTETNRWTPGLGDPTFAGWLTVAAYFATAVLCWHAARKGASAGLSPARHWWFWSVFGVLLLALGINKQLDLQTGFTFFFKHIALDQGWYDSRRPVQAAFVGAVAVAGLAGLLGMKRLAGRLTGPTLVAFCGGGLLGCFVLIRASSFHHVDQLLGMKFAGVKMNWALELGSIAWIALGAGLALWSRRAAPPPGTSQRKQALAR